jgi:hypothetical protein
MADNDALMAEVQAALGGGDNAALLAQLGSALQSSKPAKEAGADPSPPKRIKPEPGTQRAYAPIAPRPAPAAPRPPAAPPAAAAPAVMLHAPSGVAPANLPARIDSGTPGMRLGPELKRAPAYGVEYEWKPETPTPEASGGHYTVDARGRGRKTQSRVGRLAGTVVLEVEATPRFADAFLGYGSAVWSNAGRRAGNKNIQHDFNMHAFERFRRTFFTGCFRHRRAASSNRSATASRTPRSRGSASRPSRPSASARGSPRARRPSSRPSRASTTATTTSRTAAATASRS